MKYIKAKSGFVLRTVMNENIIMPTDKNICDFGGIAVLNGVPAFVWQKLRQPTCQEELLDAIIEEYDVSPDTALKDLKSLLERFYAYGLIEDI